ncbi:MAG: Peptidase S24-like protein [Syntrophaceae bacterium PtaU1.Bin231]|nr:MAG: Peptidase S24-like protein [Syntrophaceae bacterium PtaU1.Bin231]
MSETGEKANGAVFCRGESMLPLFRPGDRIRFVPCRADVVRPGDVILAVPPGRDERVVHRVVSTGPTGIRTKGDANPYLDAWEFRQEDIIGRAVAVERRGKVMPVAGGPAGRLLAALIRAYRRSDHLASHVLNPCYRGIARSGICRGLIPPALRPRVITFERDGAREMQLVLGGRIIGRRPAGAVSWTIRRPFRIFLDEQALP